MKRRQLLKALALAPVAGALATGWTKADVEPKPTPARAYVDFHYKALGHVNEWMDDCGFRVVGTENYLKDNRMRFYVTGGKLPALPEGASVPSIDTIYSWEDFPWNWNVADCSKP